MRRTLALGIGTLVIAAACAGGDAATSTSTTSAPTSTATTIASETTLSPEEIAAREYEADVALIEALWRGLSDAWSRGMADAIDYMVRHNYPDLGTPDECRAALESAYGSQPSGYREEHEVDRAGVERDDGWVVPGSALTPTGRTYLVGVSSTYTAVGADPITRTIEAHATIQNGEAFLFVPCS
jgi:hypothetical protein